MEILFRGFHEFQYGPETIVVDGKKVRGEWVEGYLLKSICGRAYIVTLVDDAGTWSPEHPRLLFSEVIPSTVGQFTGLNDKNGKKIFEGDILDCVDRIVSVKWHRQAGTWDCDFIKYTGRPMCSNGITPVEWKYRAIVIGTIYDEEALNEMP